MKYRHRCISLVVSTLLLCTPLTLLAQETRFKTTGDQGHHAAQTFDQAPLVSMRPTRLVLRLLDSDSGSPAAVKGICDLTMPAMPMPENRPTLRAIGNELIGEAIFTMAGEWQATCTVELGKGKLETFVFNLGDVQL